MTETSHPTIIRIRKEENNFQRAEVIKRNREKRFRYGQFLVEGVSQITLAAQFGWSFDSFLYAEGRALSNWAQKLLKEVPALTHFEVTPDLLAKLSEKDEVSELMAIVEMRRMSCADIPFSENGLALVFDRPASPGNLGSSLRSADAFGVEGVVITGHAVDIYDPHVVRGSMGALFALPVATAPSHKEVESWAEGIKKGGTPAQIIGTSGKATKEIGEIDFAKPTILVMGNETVGMSRGYFEICDEVVKIPIGGCLSSLNVSCAASIMLYEVLRQRKKNS